MEVVNQRSALLSNYEVLTLLRELENDHLARTRTALRIKKEEEAAGIARTHAPPEEVLENLRTVEVEAIQHLSAEYQPTNSQSEAGIERLTRSLAAYDLTKAEKLQIVNLAPTEAVELYVIVEELEDRLGGQLDDILTAVRESLTNTPVAERSTEENAVEEIVYQAGEAEDYEGWDANDMVFDDTGEGAGVEGDLDVDDD
ncbi:HRDC-like protein [Abortiporus biennis]|nr:HRDC-like protein [Abortiporus biennis]